MRIGGWPRHPIELLSERLVNGNADFSLIFGWLKSRARLAIVPLGDETENVVGIPQRFDLRSCLKQKRQFDGQPSLRCGRVEDGKRTRLAVFEQNDVRLP